MIQTGNWESSRQMVADDLQLLLKKKIEEVNFDHARNEVRIMYIAQLLGCASFNISGPF